MSSSSCLSIFGLPHDATEREVHVLFSGCFGFLRCLIVPSKAGQKPYAFVQFDCPPNAHAALDARQGTSWDEMSPVVSIEMARKDIPGTFTSRAGGPPPPSYEPIKPLALVVSQPQAKRPRIDLARSHAPPPEPYADPYADPYAGAGDHGPRTLHVGGLPPSLSQSDLDTFLAANFGDGVVGSRLTGGGKGGSSYTARAFVGFWSHDAAGEAQGMLQGFNWEGCTLHAEWARSEFKAGVGEEPQNQKGGWPQLALGNGGGATHRHYAEERHWQEPPPPAPVSRPSVSIGAHWHSSGGKGGKAGDDGGGRRTLHFTNLPHVAEEAFDLFLSQQFPDAVVASRFKSSHDGRPPVAWVLFVDESSAANACLPFDWEGMSVQAAYARTELDPTKSFGR